MRIQLPGMDEEFILVVSHRAPSGHYDSYVVEGMQIFGEVVLMTLQGGKSKQPSLFNECFRHRGLIE